MTTELEACKLMSVELWTTLQPKKVRFKSDDDWIKKDVGKQAPRTQTSKKFICAVKVDDPVRGKAEDASMRFQVADVCKPLASAAKVVKNGNRVVLSQGESLVENLVSKKKRPQAPRRDLRLRCCD